MAPTEIVTERAPTYPRVLDELWPAAWHHVERYANNRVEADHAQLKRWLRPMRGIKTMTGLRILAAGNAFVQNLRRGHYEIAVDQPARIRLAAAFTQLGRAIRAPFREDQQLRPHDDGLTQHAPRDYLDRRAAEGKPRREALRCLKRYIAREIHNLIRPPQPTAAAPTGPPLAA